MTSNDWLTDRLTDWGGRGGRVVIMNFWSIVLDDHCSKKIYKPKMIVVVRCYINLRWSCFKSSPLPFTLAYWIQWQASNFWQVGIKWKTRRHAAGDCDLPEYCTGDTGECPPGERCWLLPHDENCCQAMKMLDHMFVDNITIINTNISNTY